MILALVAAGGLAVGLAIADMAAPANSRHAPSARGRAGTIRHVPTLNVQPQSAACYVGGQTCSIHPCIEFVAGKPPRRLPGARIAPGRVCVKYPSLTGTTIPVGH